MKRKKQEAIARFAEQISWFKNAVKVEVPDIHGMECHRLTTTDGKEYPLFVTSSEIFLFNAQQLSLKKEQG